MSFLRALEVRSAAGHLSCFQQRFSNGSVHISIWFDVEIHVCATNAVAAVSSAVSSSPSPLLGTSFLQVQQLPTTLIPILMQASTDDLKALAGRAGVSTGGNKSELVHRIVGQPCSSSSAVSSSSTSSPSAGLETYKLSELKAELMRLGQRTSGNKRRLLERLKRVRASSGSVASSRQRVLGFIGASASSSHSSPPTTNGFYASSFNLVDEFNRWSRWWSTSVASPARFIAFSSHWWNSQRSRHLCYAKTTIV